MIEFTDPDSETRIVGVRDGQLQFLIEQPEEEDLEDRDCAITRMPLQMFEAGD